MFLHSFNKADGGCWMVGGGVGLDWSRGMMGRGGGGGQSRRRVVIVRQPSFTLSGP